MICRSRMKKSLESLFALFDGMLWLVTGELDDDLQPVGKEVIKYEDNGEWDSEESMGQARPGTTKRKQYYEKKVSTYAATLMG